MILQYKLDREIAQNRLCPIPPRLDPKWAKYAHQRPNARSDLDSGPLGIWAIRAHVGSERSERGGDRCRFAPPHPTPLTPSTPLPRQSVRERREPSPSLAHLSSFAQLWRAESHSSGSTRSVRGLWGRLLPPSLRSVSPRPRPFPRFARSLLRRSLSSLRSQSSLCGLTLLASSVGEGNPPTGVFRSTPPSSLGS